MKEAVVSLFWLECDLDLEKIYQIKLNSITKKAGYIQPFLTQTCTIDCYFNLEEDKSMLLGGEFANINILLKKPMVIFPGDRFTGKQFKLNCIFFVVEIFYFSK